jgi:hypothetical protein
MVGKYNDLIPKVNPSIIEDLLNRFYMLKDLLKFFTNIYINPTCFA